MIALIDANNFFVSCEQALNPRLVGRPVVVLSNNDGCVISRSYEAKELGIPMGAPFFKYRDLMAKHNVVTYSVNFDLYQQFSTKIVSVLREVCPRVQVYSIDESFVELPNLSNKEVFKWCVDLRRKIFLATLRKIWRVIKREVASLLLIIVIESRYYRIPILVLFGELVPD